MEAPKKLAKNYEHVLIGFNLASISFAAKLAEAGASFCLLDSVHTGASPFKFVSSLDSSVYTRLPFVSAFAEDNSSELEGQQNTENPVTTFDKGDFKSFLGFGESKMPAMDVVDSLVTPTAGAVEGNPEEMWSQWHELIEPYTFLDQQITGIEHESGLVNSVELNGKAKVTGSNFYFFSHLPFIFDATANENKKLASQFAKAKWYSSVSLTIHHQEKPESAEANSLYMLMGSKEQPCFGIFNEINNQWVSRWESFFPAELTADAETTGTYLKEIKKQVKRAFGGSQEGREREHIVIHNHVDCHLESLGMSPGLMSNFSNLYIYSNLLTNQRGWASEVLTGFQAHADLSEEGKNSEPTLKEVAAPSTPC